MTDLVEQSQFDSVYQLETTDKVLAGPGGIANTQAQQLANRTKYLKDQLEAKTGQATEATAGIAALASQAEALAGTDDAKIMTALKVKTVMDALVAAAPGALDTLNELAAALGDDPNFATTVTNALATKATIDSLNLLTSMVEEDNFNFITNGKPLIDQKGGYNNLSTNYCFIDRWHFNNFGSAEYGINVGIKQFNNNDWISAEVVTPETVSADDLGVLVHRIEGYIAKPLRLGHADAKKINIEFKHAHTVAGTYSLCLYSATSGRSYTAEYTQSSSNVEETSSIAIQLDSDTNFTWNEINGTGLSVNFFAYAGGNKQGSIDAWNTAGLQASANQVNAFSNAGNFFRIREVQLKINNGNGVLPFSTSERSFDDELRLCERYVERSYDYETPSGTPTLTGAWVSVNLNALDFYDYGRVRFGTRKRAPGTIYMNSPLDGANGVLYNYTQNGNIGNAGASILSETGFHVYCVNTAMSPVNNAYATHWICDSELYTD